MDVETDKAVEKDKRLEQASGPVIVTDTNMRLGVVEMVKAAIDSASLSGPPASHWQSPSRNQNSDYGTHNKLVRGDRINRKYHFFHGPEGRRRAGSPQRTGKYSVSD
ncbi:hypothetical protein DPMN_041308 [Dreissena polymorpha]|uniref:Uncharacterized protein n=1 Tax=Dreissena polymorpha TaxID=45954 RepID=A0A9D4HW36_DREPO|nr:hypothetical protein DPMN_041308 [Dreissena polymorpha]